MQSILAKLFQRAKLILWDEAAMANRYHLEALNRTLKDLMAAIDDPHASEPFGGKIVVLNGDFRQTLPVVPHASRGQIVDVTLPRSILWRHFRTYRLTDNMRILQAAADGTHSHAPWDPMISHHPIMRPFWHSTLASSGTDTTELRSFSEWLLSLGDGSANDSDEKVTLPKELCEESETDEGRLTSLTTWVYSDLVLDEPGIPELLEWQRELAFDAEWLSERAILTPLNTTVDRINTSLGDAFPGCLYTDHIPVQQDPISVQRRLQPLDPIETSPCGPHPVGPTVWDPPMHL